MGYCDVHCHILPGMDDGARDMNMALGMIDIAVKNNISDIILTPHYKIDRCEHDKDRILRHIDELRSKVDSMYDNLNLYAGTELMFQEDCIELLENDKILSLNDSKMVLVEFRPSDSPTYIKNSLYKVSCTGYIPILAHVERYAEMVGNYDVVEEIIERGGFIQVNAESVIGKLGLKVKKFTKMLMKYDMLHFIGTDAHNTDGRCPNLELCASYIEKKFGSEYRDELLIKNPKKYLNIR